MTDNSILELKTELAKMVRWATHGIKHGNPYAKDEVMSALRLLAKLEGITDPYNVDTLAIANSQEATDEI